MVLQKVGQEGSGQGEEQEHQEKNLEQVQGEEQGEEQIQEVELYECETGKAAKDFRNFKNSEYQQRVEMLYHEQHTFQTLDFVRSKHKSFLTFNRAKMSIWECMTELNQLVDQSDPDTGVSQLQHALMTAQAIRKKYPGPEYEWFRVVGLIHDLGKILSLKWGEPQWAVVGDTFPVGCRFSQKCVFPHFFKENPDKNHPVYGTKNGIYQHGCGLDNLVMAWGHDEYLYQVKLHSFVTVFFLFFSIQFIHIRIHI